MTAISQASDAPKAVDLNAGDIVDERYRIVRRLGRGGMGTVYEAQQIKLDRQVALKVLLPEFAKNEISAKRFEREARAASSIDHRNVVKILDFGHLPTGELYYTMELLQGNDLAQLLRENDGPLPWSRAGWIILQVVRAFAAIHEQGIVHRDIKPANCFMLTPKAGDEPDFVKILDFGIANLQQDDGAKGPSLTGTSDILGSVLYMAPEQVAAQPVDSRTDIYSLGIMMYELLTGDVPFREQNVYKVMLAHQQKAPVPPRELNPDIPPEVADLIMCAISKSPEDRPQAMADIEKALAPLVVVPGTIEGKRTVPRTGTSMRFRDTYALKLRRRWVSMVVAAVALFVVTLALTRWIKISGKDGPDSPGGVVIVTPTEVEPPKPPPPDPGWILLLPEKEYNPFADPFGHASLAGLKVPSPDGSGTLVSLEDLLPLEPWLLEPGRVAGRIFNDRKRPLAKGSVCVWSIDPKAPVEVRKRPFCTETDSQGRFELEEVVPGYYDVNVFARGFMPKSYFGDGGYPLTVLPKGSIEGIEMTLEPGGVEVRGVVKSKLGDRLEQAKVAVVGPVRTMAITNKAGEFSLWVAEGEVSLVAWAANHADAVESGAADREFSFNLSKESVLVGSVVDEASGEPIQGARVRATPKTDGLEPLVYTNSKGEFRIPGLPAGEYEYSARTDDGYGPTVARDGAYRVEHKVIKVTEGGASQVAIKLLRSKKVAIVENENAPPPTSAEGVSATERTDDVSADDTSGGESGATAGGESGTTAGGESGAPAGGESGAMVGGEPVPTIVEGAGSTIVEGAESTVAEGAGSTVGGGAGSTVGGGAEPSAGGEAGSTVGGGAGSTAGGGAEPPVGGGSNQEQVKPSKPKPKVSNRTLRRKLAKKLERCGKNGTIKVDYTIVRATGQGTGKLVSPRVTVSGEAAKDEGVEACANQTVKGFKFLPPDDGDTEPFEELVVNL